MMSKSRPTFNVEALSRIDSRDMLVLQDTTGRVMADLTRFYETDAKADGAALAEQCRDNLEAAYGFDAMEAEDRKPFVYQDGVAVIPIHGTLINRCNWSWGFITGYQYVRRMLNAALDDDDVELIVFDVDSPGGEAAGCFELAREIMASRRVKPSLAMVDSTAASGGIALGVAPTKIYAIPSARIGSIGVYRMHVSYEDAMKQAGIKVTFATAGEHKVDGNPYQDLPQAVFDEWRESAGKTWDDFIALVAEARDLEEDEVRSTQARVYRADEALDIGLIDAVNTPTEAIAAFVAELADLDPLNDEDEEVQMATKTLNSEVTSGLTDADFAKIGAMIGTAVAGVQDNVNRVNAIRDLAATFGKGSAALAKTIIDNDAISAEAGIAMLNAAFGGSKVAKSDDEDDDQPKKGKGKNDKAKSKGKAKASDPEDDDDLDDGDDGEDDDGEDDGDDDEDDGEEAARASRRGGDRVNHLNGAMKRHKQPGVGGGRSKVEGEEGGRPKRNPLLAAHASVTGAGWSKDAIKG